MFCRAAPLGSLLLLLLLLLPLLSYGLSIIVRLGLRLPLRLYPYLYPYLLGVGWDDGQRGAYRSRPSASAQRVDRGLVASRCGLPASI